MGLFPNDDEEDNDLLALLDKPIEVEDDSEGSEMTFFPSSDEEEKAHDKEENSKEIARRLERLEEENKALKERATYVPQQTYQPQVQQPAQSLFPSTNDETRQNLINQLNQKFASNPGEALLDVFMQGQKVAEEAQRKNLYPVAAQNTKFAINQFAASANMDADTRAEFQKIVSTFTPQQLAQAAEDPAALDHHLEMVRKIARATAIENQEKAGGRRNSPPPFTGSGAAKGGIRVKMNKDQEYAAKLAKSQGFTDKQIIEMHKSGELG